MDGGRWSGIRAMDDRSVLTSNDAKPKGMRARLSMSTGRAMSRAFAQHLLSISLALGGAIVWADHDSLPREAHVSPAA